MLTTMMNARPIKHYVSLLKIAPAEDHDWDVGDVIVPLTTRELHHRNTQRGSTTYWGRHEFTSPVRVL